MNPNDMRDMLAYLSALEQHNQREWFHQNKTWYKQAGASFEALVAALMEMLRARDGSIPAADPKTLTFKLMRDTRFSHDKSPYNPTFRAHIGPQGKLPIPVGYYIMIRPGDRSFLGGGLFADMFKDATAMVRTHIAAHGDDWQRIISAPDFAAHFTVAGTALKKVPAGYDVAHPQAAYLRHKSWYLEYPVTDAQLCAPDFVANAAKVFAQMQPFNAFLNEALVGFQMPTR